MNLAIKAAAGAALLSAASMSAFATSVTPPSSGPTPVPGSAPGGIVVSVFDTTTNQYLVEWLGGDISTFGAPTAVPAGGVTLDYGTLGSTFATMFTPAEVAAGHVSFIVQAANDVNPAAPFIDVTLSSTGSVRGSAVATYASSINTGIAAVMNGATACNNLNPCTATSTTDPHYAGKYLDVATIGTFKTSGLAGGAGVNFYQIADTGTTAVETPAQFANATGAATWTLSATGDLVYSAPGASAVPLPAAVWLLGSGLLGLAGVARRKSLTA
jgi:hypothetical protein